jgi:hypothetical protein
MAQAAEKPQMLNSWKEIASFLSRGVRTVQLWERELRLPVHRIGKGKRSPVYVDVPELKFWIATSGVDSPHSGPPKGPILVSRNGGKNNNNVIETSHRLMAESLKLVRSVAETSVRQQRQAELLQKRILEIRSRMR